MAFKVGDALNAAVDDTKPNYAIKYRATFVVDQPTGLRINELTSFLWTKKYGTGDFDATGLTQVSLAH